MTSFFLLTLQVNNFWNENSIIWIGKLGCLFHIAGQNVSSDWLVHFPFDLIFLFALLCTLNVCIPLQSNIFLCAGMLIIPKRQTWLGVHVVNVRIVPFVHVMGPKNLETWSWYDLLTFWRVQSPLFIWPAFSWVPFILVFCFLSFFFFLISWQMILTVEAV